MTPTYFIVSHARTGSTLCAFLLNEYYRHLLNEPYINCVEHIDNYTKLSNFDNNKIYHTHSTVNLETLPKNFTVIFSKRDYFESLISLHVAERINQWQIFEDQQLPKIINSITIDTNLFVRQLKRKILFHQEVQNILNQRKIKYIVVDYSDIKDEPRVFYKLLDIDFNLATTENLPKKFNLDYSKIITNFEELKQLF